MHYEWVDIVHEGKTICRITNPFKSEATVVETPFILFLVGVLENSVVYPGNPLWHFAKIEEMKQQIIEERTGQIHEATA